MAEEKATTQWHRGRADLMLLIAIGLFMGLLGPFGTDAILPVRRFAYWLICMVGGGVIGIVMDGLLRRHMRSMVRQLIAVSLVMTPCVAGLVMMTGHILIGQPANWASYGALLWNVFVISLAAMTVRALAWRKVAPVIETRTIIAPPMPDAEAPFRLRLSARRRGARLIAVEAYDHYLRVHTDAGVELITMRFADALEELAAVHGYRTHRSWWVSASAIEAVQWRRGGGDVRLAGDITAPVSRTYISKLRGAGWF